MPGGRSRWSQGKDLSWEPLRPELVVEVAYEHMQGPRFRHMAHFRRRPLRASYEILAIPPGQRTCWKHSPGCKSLVLGWGRRFRLPASSDSAGLFLSRRLSRVRAPFARWIVVRIWGLLR